MRYAPFGTIVNERKDVSKQYIFLRKASDIQSYYKDRRLVP
jgi:hypothetical protein